MASIDKQSVRAEVDKVKSEFDALCAAGKADDEVRVLMIIDLILAIFMERNTRTVETITVVEVAFCDHCSEDLASVPAQAHECRTRIDILFEKVVEHVDAEIKLCPASRRAGGGFPPIWPVPCSMGMA